MLHLCKYHCRGCSFVSLSFVVFFYQRDQASKMWSFAYQVKSLGVIHRRVNTRHILQKHQQRLGEIHDVDAAFESIHGGNCLGQAPSSAKNKEHE